MRRWRLCVAMAVVLAVGVAGSAAQAAPSARVRVRGPGADSVERAVARVLASRGYRVIKGRRAALRVSGRVRGGEQGKRRVSLALTVRSGGAVVGRLRVRAASRRAALAGDPQVMRRTGSVAFVADLALEYGFTDVDGRVVPRFDPSR